MAKKKKLSKQERFALLVPDLQKRYPGRVLLGNEYTAPWSIKRCPTGLLNLDIATNGGLPCGGMTVLVGRENAGKNWLLWNAIMQQQLLYGEDCRFAIVGTEMAADKDQARKVGVVVPYSEDEIEAKDRSLHRNRRGKTKLTSEDIDDLRRSIGTFVFVPPETAEKTFDITAELVDSNTFSIVAIDSFGSILPEEEQDKSLEENMRVSGAAGLNTRFMRKINAAFAPDENGDPNLTCLIGTNQLRANIGAQSFQKKTQEGGGWALKHGRFVTIELTRTAWVKEGKTKIGKVMQWELTKQKAGGHDGHMGDYTMFYGPPMVHDRAGMALTMAAPLGLVTKKGAYYYMDGVCIGQGLAAASEFLMEKDLVEELEEEVMIESGVSYLL